MAASSLLLSSSIPPLISKHKTLHLISAQNSFPSSQSSTERSHCFKLSPNAVPLKPTKRWEISANLGNYLLSEADPVESTQEIVAASPGGVSNVIQALLIIAFVGLSVLTLGVVYIAVTDFLTKRDREKFEKEEAAKKKKRSGKKGIKPRSRVGPKGFGQKIEEDDYIDED